MQYWRPDGWQDRELTSLQFVSGRESEKSNLRTASSIPASWANHTGLAFVARSGVRRSTADFFATRCSSDWRVAFLFGGVELAVSETVESLKDDP